MAFEAFLTQDKARPKKGRRIMIMASLAAHGALLAAGLVYSFWHVDELSPPTVTITFLSNPPPPPPPPPPAKKKSTKAKVTPKEVVQPKPNEIIQPKKEEEPQEEDEGVEGGVEGGVAGGVVGATGTGQPVAQNTPPPPPPKADPPKFVPPNVGAQQLLINPRVPPYKVVMPAAFSRAGMRLWAMLQICVSPSGAVSNVSVIKGMDPAVDPLLASKVRTWKYKPMSVDGRPVPFCYRLRYEHQT